MARPRKYDEQTTKISGAVPRTQVEALQRVVDQCNAKRDPLITSEYTRAEVLVAALTVALQHPERLHATLHTQHTTRKLVRSQ